MVFHVGVDGFMVCIYDSDNQKIQILTDDTIFTTLELLFKSIEINITDEKGYLCVCCDSEDTNHFRKEVIKFGIQYGFQEVDIIDEITALYYCALSESAYVPKNSDFIYILYNQKCYIWFKTEFEAEMIKIVEKEDFARLDKIMIGWGFKESFTNSSHILLHEYYIDINVFKHLSLPFNYFSYIFKGFAKAALTKALILDEDSSVKISHVTSLLERAVEIIIGKKQIIILNPYQKLPLQRSLELKKYKTDRPLYVISYSNDNNKRIDEAFFVPAREKYSLILKVDKNGILSINLKRHILANINYYGKSNVYYSRFTSMPLNLIFQREHRHNKLFGGNCVVENDIVGIDLGTTRCFASVFRKDNIEVIALDNKGERKLPSYISFDERNAKCGKLVIKRMRNFGKSTAFDLKRIIGRQFNEINMEDSWSFQINNTKSYIQIEVDDCKRKSLKYPEEILSVLLKHIKQEAEEFQGRKLDAVVISCPVSFTKAQEDAIHVTALLAGWKKIHLLSDSIAAVSMYFVERIIKINTLLLIIDLGGGNLNFAIVEAVKSKPEFIQFQGVTNISELEKCGIKVEKQEVIHKLLSKCEEVKLTLSVEDEAWLDIDEFDASQEGLIEITRHEFENLCAHLLIEIKDMLIENLEFYNYNDSQIDKVLLLGGGSRMPMIPALIKEMFHNAEILKEKNPDEMVARGALYYAEGDTKFQSYAFSYKERSCFLHIFL